MPTLTRIAIVEHHSLVRRGLESLLSSSPALRLDAVVSEPRHLTASEGEFHVIVFGPTPMEGADVVENVRQLTRKGRVLLIASSEKQPLITEALRAGAFGCITSQSNDEELLRAVDTVASGGLHLAAPLTSRLRHELEVPVAAPLPTLARREIEALRWLAAGLTHGQIARRMALTEATVSTYVKRIRTKLNVGNKADLTRKAIELGLLEEEGDGQRRQFPRVPPAA